jgi:hypothetical protein
MRVIPADQHRTEYIQKLSTHGHGLATLGMEYVNVNEYLGPKGIPLRLNKGKWQPFSTPLVVSHLSFVTIFGLTLATIPARCRPRTDYGLVYTTVTVVIHIPFGGQVSIDYPQYRFGRTKVLRSFLPFPGLVNLASVWLHRPTERLNHESYVPGYEGKSHGKECASPQ